MKEKILKDSLLGLVILITIIAVFIMPETSRLMAESMEGFSFLRIPGLIIIYLSLIPFYIGAYQGWKLINMTYGTKIFSTEAIRSLSIIRRCSSTIFFIYLLVLLVLFFIRPPLTSAYLTIAILTLASLSFSLTMSIAIRLVGVAKDYKEENDLTI